MMFRNKIIVLFILLFAGCSSYVFVKPFIDVDETLLLSPLMRKSTILENIGTPIEVRAGIYLTDSSVVEIWLYNVKEKLAKISKENINTKPPRNIKAEKWDVSQKYALFFINDHLTKWGYLEDVWPQFDKNGDVIAPIHCEKTDVSNEGNNNKGSVFGILKLLKTVTPPISATPTIVNDKKVPSQYGETGDFAKVKEMHKGLIDNLNKPEADSTKQSKQSDTKNAKKGKVGEEDGNVIW